MQLTGFDFKEVGVLDAFETEPPIKELVGAGLPTYNIHKPHI
jgi:hypothetical protein